MVMTLAEYTTEKDEGRIPDGTVVMIKE